MPAMNGTQITAAFKILGKLIFFSQKGPTDATTYRTAMSGIVDQCATGASGDANAITNVAAPSAAAIASIAQNLDSITATAKTYVQAYLERVMAVDQGKASGTNYATVGTQLVADMAAASHTVTASGGNLTGIKWYMASNFGIILPESGSPTIPDSYITATPN